MTQRYTLDTAKTTQYSEAWLLLALILLAAGLILRSAFLSAAAATLLTVAAVAWLWNRAALRGLAYTRALSETRAFPGETVTLTLELHNRKPLPLTWLIARDNFPAPLPVDGRTLVVNPATNLADFTTFWMPAAAQRIRRTFTIACDQRGIYRFGPARIETGDGFGFFESRRALSHADTLIVYPRLLTLEELRLPTRSPFGPRRATHPLHEDPLRPIGAREHQQGDELRRIHWKATARRGELFSRLYEPSEELQVQIALNVTTMPRHWQGVNVALHERAISVAASLAALAIEQRIPTGLIANGAMPGSDQRLRLLPGRSHNQLLRIFEMLAAVSHFATDPIEEMIEGEARRLPWGATLVVVSAIAHEPLLAALEEIAQSGRRVVLASLAETPPAPLPRVEVWQVNNG